MMFRIPIILFLIIISVDAFSQKTIDVLFLQNGSIIKGNILKNDESGVNIETCCGSIFAYQQSEIKSIGSEKQVPPSRKIKECGYLNYSSMGMLLGSTSNEKQAQLSILSEHDYKFKNNFAIGILTGFEFLNETTVPLAACMKIFAPLKKQDLFIGVTGGYNFSVENPESGFYSSYTGGAHFNIEIGTIIPLSENNAFFVALGYRYNELHYTIDYWWEDSIDRVYYFNRISLRLGLVLY
jgi:hypothetical protein